MKPERDASAFQVQRTIPLANLQPEMLESAVRSLGANKWLNEVRSDGRRLHLSYDASCVNFRDIERLLDEANLKRPSSFGWRCRAAWYRFLDTNARSNALSQGGACCSRPPTPWRGGDRRDPES